MSEHCACCGCASDDFMEDMPMCRHPHPIPTCDHKGTSCNSCANSCECHKELEQILTALSCQNQLLVDLLGAVNCLTAALLAERTQDCGC